MNAASHLVGQIFLLTAMVGLLFVLQTLAGGWIVFAFFPRRDAMRWPIYAPIAGMAYLMAVGLPLALLGVRVSRFALPIVVIGALATLFLAWRFHRAATGGRVLWMFVRLRWLSLAVVSGIVIVLTSSIVVGRSGGSAVGASGSGDFGAYWVVAEYLQDHAPTVSAYRSQTEFQTL